MRVRVMLTALRSLLPTIGFFGAALTQGACGEDPATLTRVETEVFSTSCTFSACHSGPAPKAGLSLVSPTHGKLVDVFATERPDKRLVAPGDPDASFLYDKMIGRDLPSAPSGEPAWVQMPPGVQLEADRIELVSQWIAAGALDD